MKKLLPLFVSLVLMIAWQVGQALFSNQLIFNLLFFSLIFATGFVLLLFLSFRSRIEKKSHEQMPLEHSTERIKREPLLNELFEKEKIAVKRWQEEVNLPSSIKSDLRDLLARRGAGDALDQAYIQWAINALEQDVDTPSLRILAGLVLPADRDDIDQYFSSTLKELTIPQPDQSEMVIPYFHYICRMMIKGAITADRGIDLIHENVVGPLGHPDRLMPWCFIWEGNNPDGSFAELKGAEREELIIEYANRELESVGMSMRTKFKMHQRVRVAKLINNHKNILENGEHAHAPQVGDKGRIVDIYYSPHEAYCVECTNDNGTIWLDDFLPEELESAQ